MEPKSVNNLPASDVQIQSILNKKDGTLPFGYFEPSQDGKLTWNCAIDQEGRIISVFCYNFGSHKDKQVSQLQNMNAALFARDELIKAGWHKLKTPEITITYEDGKEKPLNRAQKRGLSKQLSKMNKSNPFESDDANRV